MFGRISEGEAQRVARRKRQLGLSRTSLAVSVFILELCSIVAIATVTGIAYHKIVYAEIGDIGQYAGIGGIAGLIYGLTFLVQDEYGVESLLEGRRSNGRLLLVWNIAFAALAIIGFLTKSTAEFSRGWLVLFYAAGLIGAIALNAAVHRSLGSLIERGLIRPRRLMLVGTGEEITKMEREISDGAPGVLIVARLSLPEGRLEDEEAADRLENALYNARTLGVEDVIISGAPYDGDFISRSVSAFSQLPVVIHLGAGGLVGRFKDARVARFGRTTTLSLTREPLRPFEAAAKRLVDLAGASLALLLLAPLLFAVGVLVKLDSKGPVFFRQRRRGYNHEEFGIWKFRTMSTLDDGDTIKQAQQGDARITRFGQYLRKYSIDELPQLINVLRGEMSLVGPRPHAVAHDRFFEKRIAMYPRRLNVKPGITGWAQVNGFRGATETDESMALRLEHDLYYIDNWSLLFDFYIMLLTVLSRKTMQNAY